MYALKADTIRNFGRFSWPLVIKGLLTQQSFRVLAAVRFCQAAQQAPTPLRWLLLTPARVFYQVASQLGGMELPWRTQLAPGLQLTHGRGIVVSKHARVGSNVTLFHGVTLGQGDYIDDAGRRITGYPVVQDGVWIGPHAIIVGNITVGQGSRIAGGAYVYRDVPPRSMVVGNPARIVKSNCEPDITNPFHAEAAHGGMPTQSGAAARTA